MKPHNVVRRGIISLVAIFIANSTTLALHFIVQIICIHYCGVCLCNSALNNWFHSRASQITDLVYLCYSNIKHICCLIKYEMLPDEIKYIYHATCTSSPVWKAPGRRGTCIYTTSFHFFNFSSAPCPLFVYFQLNEMFPFGTPFHLHSHYSTTIMATLGVLVQ